MTQITIELLLEECRLLEEDIKAIKLTIAKLQEKQATNNEVDIRRSDK
jgi:hypothetical protein